jgi:hypothetical protein
MIVVLSELHGAPRVFEVDRRGLVRLARLVHEGVEESEPPGTSEQDPFDRAWARLRRIVRHARHFANFPTALHFYRFGNHGLDDAAAARIVRELVKVRAVAPEPWPSAPGDTVPVATLTPK